jgi:AAA domain-containing protein
MKVVTFSIFKGGTAKTTSTVNTAAALTNKGKKVLVIDLDQQASATRYLDLDPDGSPNLYEVFMGVQQAPLAVRKSKHGVDVLSSHVLMAAIEEALEPGDETKLSDLIMPLRGPDYNHNDVISRFKGRRRTSYTSPASFPHPTPIRSPVAVSTTGRFTVRRAHDTHPDALDM